MSRVPNQIQDGERPATLTNMNSYAFYGIRAAAVAIFVFAGALELSAQDSSEYTKSKIQGIYMSYLLTEGYVPKVDEDGDVQFKKEGRSYYIDIDEKDPKFFQLVFAAFWEIESEAERREALLACNAANLKTKVTKVYIVRDYAWASAEMFAETPEDFLPVFRKALSALDGGVKNFVEEMRD